MEDYLTIAAVVAIAYYLLPFTVAFLNLPNAIIAGLLWPLSMLWAAWTLIVAIAVALFLLFSSLKSTDKKINDLNQEGSRENFIDVDVKETPSPKENKPFIQKYDDKYYEV